MALRRRPQAAAQDITESCADVVGSAVVGPPAGHGLNERCDTYREERATA